jgi:hypothetical protein
MANLYWIRNTSCPAPSYQHMRPTIAQSGEIVHTNCPSRMFDQDPLPGQVNQRLLGNGARGLYFRLWAQLFPNPQPFLGHLPHTPVVFKYTPDMDAKQFVTANKAVADTLKVAPMSSPTTIAKWESEFWKMMKANISKVPHPRKVDYSELIAMSHQCGAATAQQLFHHNVHDHPAKPLTQKKDAIFGNHIHLHEVMGVHKSHHGGHALFDTILGEEAARTDSQGMINLPNSRGF